MQVGWHYSKNYRVLQLLFTLGFGILICACHLVKTQSSDNSKFANEATGTPTPAALDCGGMTQIECDVVNLVNVERSKSNLSLLGVLAKCVNAAGYHADDMAANNYFAHDGLTETWSQRMLRFGLSGNYVAENIAYNQSTPALVMDSWMNSSGHRANILNANYQSMGVGVSTNGGGGKYWVQCFSGYPSDSVAPN